MMFPNPDLMKKFFFQAVKQFLFSCIDMHVKPRFGYARLGQGAGFPSR
jgi:hypothetical protein